MSSDWLVDMFHRIQNAAFKLRWGIRAVGVWATLVHVLDGLRRIGKCIPADLRRVQLIDLVGFVEYLALDDGVRMVITDFGEIHEETTFLQIPCLTFRTNSERPVTMKYGTSRLEKSTSDDIRTAADLVLATPFPVTPRCSQFWDGGTAERITSNWRQFAKV